jgi:hypothetical protein
MITSVEEMIAQYVSAWNETTLEGYQREFAKCYAADAVYTDPYSEHITGVDGIVDFAYKSLAIVPERIFTVAEQPAYHHHVGKYIWKVEAPAVTNTGYDYFEFNDQFQITRLVSFFKLPEDYPLDKLRE